MTAPPSVRASARGRLVAFGTDHVRPARPHFFRPSRAASHNRNPIRCAPSRTKNSVAPITRHWISTPTASPTVAAPRSLPPSPCCSTAILISSMIAFLGIEKSTNHHFHRNISRPKSLAKFSPTFSMHALPCRKPFSVLQVGGMPIYSAPPKLDLWDDFRLKRAGQS